MIDWKGERFYNLAEVAKFLNKTKQQVDDALARGDLKGSVVGGVTMVSEADLRAYMSTAPHRRAPGSGTVNAQRPEHE
jgi:hypothetical protein